MPFLKFLSRKLSTKPTPSRPNTIMAISDYLFEYPKCQVLYSYASNVFYDLLQKEGLPSIKLGDSLVGSTNAAIQLLPTLEEKLIRVEQAHLFQNKDKAFKGMPGTKSTFNEDSAEAILTWLGNNQDTKFTCHITFKFGKSRSKFKACFVHFGTKSDTSCAIVDMIIYHTVSN